MSITDGTPGKPVLVPGTGTLNGVACPSVGQCEAVGLTPDQSTAAVVPISNGAPGALALAPEATFDAVSCISSAMCEVVGVEFTHKRLHAVVGRAPLGQVGPLLIVDRSRSLASVSCSPNGACEAGGVGPLTRFGAYNGAVVGIATDGTPGSVHIVPGAGQTGGNGGYPVTGIACPLANRCEAVSTQFQGQTGATISVRSGGLGQLHAGSTIPALYAVGCTAAARCVAVGVVNAANPSGGAVMPVLDGVPGAVQDVPSIDSFNGVACPDTSCTAVGYDNTAGVVVTGVTP